jgi:hypothetical protein
MKKLLTLACLIGFAATLIPPTADAATAKKKKRSVAAPQGQVACTVNGCHPVPAGCTPTMGYTWGGMPSGYDVVVCPHW